VENFFLKKYFNLNKAKFNKAKNNLSYYYKELSIKISEDSLFTMISAISFDMVLAVIPFLLILLTILGIYLQSDVVSARLSTELNQFLPFTSDLKDKFISKAFDVIDELRKNTLISGLIGIGGFLWTSSGIFATMRDVLNRVFKFKEKREFVHDKLKDFMIVFIVIIFFILTLAITSISRIINIYNPEIFGVRLDLSYMQTILTYLVGWGVSFWMFFIIFKIVPNFKISFKVASFTSLITSFFYEIFKVGFTFYILNFSNYQKVYGAFAALVLSLLWIYFTSVIFIFGAAIGSIYFHKNNYKLVPKKKIKKNGTKETL